MKKFLRAASAVVFAINDHRRAIGLILTALVTLIGVDTATEERIIPPEITPGPIDTLIKSGA